MVPFTGCFEESYLCKEEKIYGHSSNAGGAQVKGYLFHDRFVP
jgi:hypothetical protein